MGLSKSKCWRGRVAEEIFHGEAGGGSSKNLVKSVEGRQVGRGEGSSPTSQCYRTVVQNGILAMTAILSNIL